MWSGIAINKRKKSFSDIEIVILMLLLLSLPLLLLFYYYYYFIISIKNINHDNYNNKLIEQGALFHVFGPKPQFNLLHVIKPWKYV